MTITSGRHPRRMPLHVGAQQEHDAEAVVSRAGWLSTDGPSHCPLGPQATGGPRPPTSAGQRLTLLVGELADQND
ncbi:MAG TPA: hypothetical protein VFC19_29455 [Candidatus Limnocylindrales bacterium]|nr:hypothetical protein [Candidatus Limnocylindrales bacterium]